MVSTCCRNWNCKDHCAAKSQAMPTLTVIAGLPGSGKTHLVKEMARSQDLGLATSDYMKNSIGDLPQLEKSRHHQQLIDALGAGKDCVVADIVFVRKNKRSEFLGAISHALPGVSIKWICFENDWLQCLKNVDQRAGNDSDKFERDATELVKLTRRYSVAEGAEIRQVWKGS